MQQRRLGQSSLSVTPLALGGNVFGWTADEPTSFAILDAFVALGGNAIDTADGYSYWVPGHSGGESETVIGRWLKQRGRHDDVVIGTKVGWWEKRKGLKRANIIDGCEDSLRRLGMETIDLYWLHRDDDETQPAEFLGALDTLVKSGKVRAVGASNFGVARFTAALAESEQAGSPRFVAQQPEYSLLNRDIEKDLMPLCVSEGIAILPYFPLASGFLTGKYRTSSDKTKSVRGGGAVKHLEGKGKPVLAALDAVAERHGATCAQVALAWIMAKPAIAAPVASATSVAQITELMGALELDVDGRGRGRARPGERMTRSVATRVVAAAALFSCCATFTTASAEERNPFEGNEVAIGIGRTLFANRCADCHGPDAKGKLGPDLTQRWARGASDESAFNIIRNGVAGSSMPPSIAPDSELWAIVAHLRSISVMPPLVSTGNAERGRKWFADECSSCHQVRGEGGALGPDLTTIGAARSRVSLTTSVRDPSATVALGFRAVTAVTRAGERVEGVVKGEDAFSIQIVTVGGELAGVSQAGAPRAHASRRVVDAGLRCRGL